MSFNDLPERTRLRIIATNMLMEIRSVFTVGETVELLLELEQDFIGDNELILAYLQAAMCDIKCVEPPDNLMTEVENV